MPPIPTDESSATEDRRRRARGRHSGHLIAELKCWRLASPPSELDLVFPTGTGGIENASNLLNRGLAPAIRRAGIRRIDVHSLRHAYASLMIEACVNLKRLQILMGHSSFRVTMDTYAHLVPDVQATSGFG